MKGRNFTCTNCKKDTTVFCNLSDYVYKVRENNKIIYFCSYTCKHQYTEHLTKRVKEQYAKVLSYDK